MFLFRSYIKASIAYGSDDGELCGVWGFSACVSVGTKRNTAFSETESVAVFTYKGGKAPTDLDVQRLIVSLYSGPCPVLAPCSSCVRT